ncbi:MAG: bifunctional N-acetylglucosamine-1-phosphate uridyltransferase/glucosamine-1-phosphate acetyltransferase [bacterium]
MADRELVGIILAAGDSTRMKSETPKVLHPILGHPMLEYIIKSLRGTGIKKLLVVIGFKKEKVVNMFRDFDIEFVTQEERLGTAHAVLQTLPFLAGLNGDCIITCGDTPLIRKQTLRDIYQKHIDESADLTILTAHLDNPTGYGRIMRDERGRVAGIVEEKDATKEQRNIKEVNTGIYCFKIEILFNLLDRIGNENKQGEYYLTDCVSLARNEGLNISNHLLEESLEIYGVNNRVELAFVSDLVRKKKLETLMLNGVTIIDPKTTYIGSDVIIGRDTIISPCVVIEGKTVIGKECVVNPFTYIKDLHIGDGEVFGKSK